MSESIIKDSIKMIWVHSFFTSGTAYNQNKHVQWKNTHSYLLNYKYKQLPRGLEIISHSSPLLNYPFKGIV